MYWPLYNSCVGTCTLSLIVNVTIRHPQPFLQVHHYPDMLVVLLSFHWFLATFWSFIITASSTLRFLLAIIHLFLSCRDCTYSFLHLDQNRLARYCVLRHLFIQYRSCLTKMLGGDSTTFVFIVSKLLGISGVGASGKMRWSVTGRPLTIFSGFTTKVLKSWSSNCVPCWSSNTEHISHCVYLPLPNTSHVASIGCVHVEYNTITLVFCKFFSDLITIHFIPAFLTLI